MKTHILYVVRLQTLSKLFLLQCTSKLYSGLEWAEGNCWGQNEVIVKYTYLNVVRAILGKTGVPKILRVD